VDTVIVSGVIRSSLYNAMDLAASDVFGRDHRERLTWSLADIYEYRVDMSRDLRVGDAFRVIAERKVAPSPNGMTTLTKFERILGASFTLSGVTTDVVRFRSDRVGGDFFDGNGKSMRAGFLRNPVAFRRISSGFGMRRHPILGIMRKHEGMDYAASSGTPIRAVGDGVVIRANYNSGYGNVVEIRHPNGYVTRYGHMKGFAPGIARGTRVTIEQTIGYVGSTGLSTAPHLHFEVLVDGQQRNPRTALANHDSNPIPTSERVAFAEARSRVLALLDGPSLASVEQAGAARGTQQ
jgi:murein DD-endopeptidase MepM/ murein hydrolase activator NlpD